MRVIVFQPSLAVWVILLQYRHNIAACSGCYSKYKLTKVSAAFWTLFKYSTVLLSLLTFVKNKFYCKMSRPMHGSECTIVVQRL